MVLQRDKPIRIFGSAQANDRITIAIGELKESVESDAEGRWNVTFEPIALGTEASNILVKNITSGEQLEVKDVLLGDVWVLGGQSNMEFEISKVYKGDIEIISAHFPQIRLLMVPAGAAPDQKTNFEPINEFNNFYKVHEWKGRWDACSPKTVRQFSAIGTIFGQRLHRAGQIPIGLIDASRGGTTVEMWTSRSSLEKIRPQLYNKMFQTMIRDWRAVFLDKDLPFGIIGFSAGGEPQTCANFEARMVDAAPYIREAQCRAALEMKNVAYVASWDQQMNWYHPFKKVALGERIARWALAQTLVLHAPWESARVLKYEVVGQAIVLTFDQEVITHEGRDFEGFAIASEDRHFYPAAAKWVLKGKDDRGRDQFDRNRLTVSHPLVPNPVAVRHAWARNPLGNGVSNERRVRILPIPGFRTDSWDYPENPLVPHNDPGMGAHRKRMKQLRQRAETWAKERIERYGASASTSVK